MLPAFAKDVLPKPIADLDILIRPVVSMDFVLELGVLVECRTEHMPVALSTIQTLLPEDVEGHQRSFVHWSTHGHEQYRIDEVLGRNDIVEPLRPEQPFENCGFRYLSTEITDDGAQSASKSIDIAHVWEFKMQEALKV